MKHQIFRNNVYVEVDTGKNHLILVGQVKDSTISLNRIPYEQLFNIPQESVELHPRILVIYEDPETKPCFIDDIVFIEDMINGLAGLDGLTVKKGKLYASVLDMSIPDENLKQMYYKLNQRAK